VLRLVDAKRGSTLDRAAERAALLKRLGLTLKGSAEVIPISHPVRKPLGLAPADGPGDDVSTRDLPSFHFHFADGHDQAYLDNSVSAGWVFGYLDVIGGIMIELHNGSVGEINNLQDRLARKFQDIESARRTAAAELKATIAELRGEVRELKAIQEAARIASRGEAGLQGPRGIPGPPGSEGRAGPQGPAGRDAAMVAAWEPDAARFSITPVCSDGSRGVPLNLKGLFEAYNAATEADDE